MGQRAPCAPLSPRLVWLSLIALLGLVVLVSGCPRKPGATPTASALPPTTPSIQKKPEATGEPKPAKPAADEEEKVPAEYASLSNPLTMDAQTIARGQGAFQKHCAGCHGPAGRGDGPKAATMQPRPADLTDPDMQKEMTDQAYFWRVSEGIPGHHMPAFKSRLSEQDRWCLVCCVRSLATSAGREGKPGSAGRTGK